MWRLIFIHPSFIYASVNVTFAYRNDKTLMCGKKKNASLFLSSFYAFMQTHAFTVYPKHVIICYLFARNILKLLFPRLLSDRNCISFFCFFFLPFVGEGARAVAKGWECCAVPDRGGASIESVRFRKNEIHRERSRARGSVGGASLCAV